MDVSRSRTPEFMNSVVNHPAVRPHVYANGDAPIDVSPLIGQKHHMVLEADHGGMIFSECSAGLWEAHTVVLPEGRGTWASEMVMACGEWMFSRTNAFEIFTRVPAGNIAAKALTRLSGMKVEQTAWQTLSGQKSLVEVYSGRLQDWIKIAPGLVEKGREFHDRLEAAVAAAGVEIPKHADDDWHDRHVGAAAVMILNGQTIKGCQVYNRWAAMALAPQVKLLSLDPVVIDIHHCKIVLRDGNLEVLKCQ